MTRTNFLLSAGAVAALAGGASAQGNRVFELRTYYTLPGTNVGYWVPADAPRSENTLIYVLAHASREAAKKSWDGFRSDPEWVKARAESEKDGKIVDKVESVYLNPVDFSALR